MLWCACTRDLLWYLLDKMSIEQVSIEQSISSINTVLAFGLRGCEFESCQYQCSREKLSVLEIPLDKELTVNCPIETHTKLGADPGCNG